MADDIAGHKPIGFAIAGFTAAEIDEIAAAMVEADGLMPDHPSYPNLWSNYQMTARRYVAAHMRLREIQARG